MSTLRLRDDERVTPVVQMFNISLQVLLVKKNFEVSLNHSCAVAGDVA